MIIRYILCIASGMVVLVHDNAQIPTVETRGMTFGPGQHHRIIYSVKRNKLLPSPYTDCQNKVNLPMQAMLDQYNGTDYGYTQYECFFPCIQAYK